MTLTKNGTGWALRWRWRDGDVRKILDAIDGSPRPLVHICSGSSNIGDVRIDLKKIDTLESNERFIKKYTGHLNVVGNMYQIPIKTGSAGTVICDPPYIDEARDGGLIDELVRILQPGGMLIFYAPWVPRHLSLEVVSIDPMPISRKSNIHKLFIIYHKNQASLFDFK